MTKEYSSEELSLLILKKIKEGESTAEDPEYIPFDPRALSTYTGVPPETISSIAAKLDREGVIIINSGFGAGGTFLISIPEDSFNRRFSKLKDQFQPEEKRAIETPIYNNEDSDIDDQILSCGPIEVNLTQATIKYKEKPAHNLALGSNHIKLLIFLLESKKLMEYKELAQKLVINSYHENVSNKNMSRDIQLIKKDLVVYLKGTLGLSNTEVEDLIISVRKHGYKINCRN